ncbi:MAG: prepilin-type N-terminal cleavage/methylation domain-containing protein [Paraglaciecola sp.]|nr:prepilin-type N-terminal cleavage/methylation domain-containing protein [Paraglaciecola sp.]NCT47906.1 prepilin-type N-terminal cleavage/methylation domain-containing protein [Paraglaciecola sp.]
MKNMTKQQGFTLIELMISLTLGLLISAAVIQIMLGNNVTEKLNQGMAQVQESGRFIVSRLRNDLLMTGRYDLLSPQLNRDPGTDVVVEAAYIQNNPVALPGDFAADPAIGVIEGASGGNDTLVVTMQAATDCRGYKLGYAVDEEFFVVNQYFVNGTSLQCRGFDGRVLRGQKVAVGNDGDQAYTLLDEVYSFQIQYGVTDVLASQDNSSRPVRFVDADALPALRNAGSQVVAIRIALLIRADADVVVDSVPTFRLLDEVAVQPAQQSLFRQFETTISLRNVKNFIRSRNI